MKFCMKSVTYDTIKSHKKTGLHHLPRRCSFGKTTWRESNEPPSQDLQWLFQIKHCDKSDKTILIKKNVKYYQN